MNIYFVKAIKEINQIFHELEKKVSYDDAYAERKSDSIFMINDALVNQNNLIEQFTII